MSNRWVIDKDYPNGHLVPMTAAEEAQLANDRQAWSVSAAAQDVADQRRRALVAKLAGGSASTAEVQQALAELLGGAT